MVISVGVPLKIGIYENENLIDEIADSGKSSDVLPVIFREIMHEYEIKRVFYTKGPGSFMSIKIAYVFLKSLCVIKRIELYAADAFLFNNGLPIKSVGKSFFVKEGDDILIKKIDDYTMGDFAFKKKLEQKDFSKEVRPMYIAPAV